MQVRAVFEGQLKALKQRQHELLLQVRCTTAHAHHVAANPTLASLSVSSWVPLAPQVAKWGKSRLELLSAHEVGHLTAACTASGTALLPQP